MGEATERNSPEKTASSRIEVISHSFYHTLMIYLKGQVFCFFLKTYACNPSIDLGSILTFWVGVLRSSHLQHAHPKGIDVYRFIILLLVHLWSHELRCSWWSGKKKKGYIPYKCCQNISSQHCTNDMCSQSTPQVITVQDVQVYLIYLFRVN